MEEKQEKKEKSFGKSQKPIQKPQEEKRMAEVLIRVFSTDVPGNLKVYHGLTKVKGISWAMSNAICNSINLDKNKKMQELTEKDLEMITNFIKSPKMPDWLLNRRNDEETGETKHLITSDLDMAKEFDIRKMKKMKSYKGWRHAMGQPVRGQRTKSHFRKGGAMGVQKSKAKPGAAAPAAAKAPKEAKK
jgi:small subunit ribosomal protein S13